MIPTQPTVPNPFEIHRDSNTANGYTCYGCGQWVANMQYHNCPGPGWQPVRTIPASPAPRQDFYPVESQGLLTETMIYSDFKKLIKRDTLAKFRERLIGRFEHDESLLPDDEKPLMIEVSAIGEVFDAVARGFYDDNSV